MVVGRDEATKTETVEVAHEALIQRWGKLRVWMDAERVFRTWQERLRGALRQWEASGRDDDALLRGALLAEAERWLEARQADLGPAERGYILAGVARRERARDARERRRRWTFRVVVAVAVVMGVTAALAFSQARRAGKAETLARARLLNYQGQAASEDQPLLGLRLALEGLTLFTPEDSLSRTSVAQSVSEIAQKGRLLKLGIDFDAVVPSLMAPMDRSSCRAARSEELGSADGATIARLMDKVDFRELFFSPDPAGSHFFVKYEHGDAELRRIDGNLVPVQSNINVDYPNFRFSPDPAAKYLWLGANLVRFSNGTVIPLKRDISDVNFSRLGDYCVIKYDDRSQELRHGGRCRLPDSETSRISSTRMIRLPLSPDPAATYTPDPFAFQVKIATPSRPQAGSAPGLAESDRV